MQSDKFELVKYNNESEGEVVIFIGPRNKVVELTEGLEYVVAYGFTPEDPDPKRFIALSIEFKNLILKAKLTRLTLVGVDWGGAIVVHYASENIKNVRRVVFVDALSRPMQHPLEVAFEWMERFLPLGLPFRAISRDFDPRPTIHRVRCPVLVLTQNTGEELEKHAKFFMERLPNAWRAEISAGDFKRVFHTFLCVPTKQPQKTARGTA